jgi:hypothetical protein
MAQTAQSTESMPKEYLEGETKAQRKERKRLAREAALSNLPHKNYVACLKWGEKYSADYVNKLYAMVSRNLTIPHEFICFTENPKGLDPNIKRYPLPNLGAHGWWYKPMFVGNDLPVRGTLLFLDLDVIVFRNIDKLFDYSPNQFCICRDFNRHVRQNWNRVNSSVFRVNIGQYNELYQKFKRNPAESMRSLRGDQDWMYKHIKDHTCWPDEWIMSYKWEMRDKRDLEIDTKTRKRNFSIDAPPRINKDTCIAVFHGEPNPQDANDSWVQQHWG